MKKYRRWIIEGMIFVIIMMSFSIVLDIINHDFTWNNMFKRTIVWLIGGLVYSFVMYFAYKISLNKLKNDN